MKKLVILDFMELKIKMINYTKFDYIAYDLYCKYIYNINENDTNDGDYTFPYKINYFVSLYNSNYIHNIHNLNKYYEQANLILRKNKILKIRNNFLI